MEYQNLFIMLNHLRSIEALQLFIGSYTRSDTPPSATARCLKCLRGLAVFLRENFSLDEQKKFMRKTFPFIAKSAAMLEERVPITGMPFLSKQESKRRSAHSTTAQSYLQYFLANYVTKKCVEKLFLCVASQARLTSLHVVLNHCCGETDVSCC